MATASGVLTLTTVGETFPPLRPLALLAPRDPAAGPQGYPVNRGAANAGVVDLARSADYRLTVGGRVATPLSFDHAQLLALPAHGAHLPIACVEGWSYSAAWSGIRVRDLLARAGAARDRTVLVEPLEPSGPIAPPPSIRIKSPTARRSSPPTSTASCLPSITASRAASSPPTAPACSRPNG